MKKKLLTAGIADNTEFYDYRGKRLTEVFERFYTFADGFLYFKKSSRPTYVYFANDPTPNLSVVSKPQYHKMVFNYGILELFYDFFNGRAEVFNRSEFADVRRILAPSNQPTFYCFFKYYSMFLFFHAYAHIAQGVAAAEFKYWEYPNTFPSDVMATHAKELDADWFATVMMGRHILEQVLDSRRVLKVPMEDVRLYCSMILAAVLCFWTKIETFFSKRKIQQLLHPHPYVRVSWIAYHLVGTMTECFGRQGFTAKNCVAEAMNLARLICDAGVLTGGNKIDPLTEFVPIAAHIGAVSDKINLNPAALMHRPLKELL